MDLGVCLLLRRRRMRLGRRMLLNRRARLGCWMLLNRRVRLGRRMLRLCHRVRMGLRLMLCLNLGLHRLHFRPGSNACEPPMLKFHESGHGLELGFQFFGSVVVLTLELFDQFLELNLRCVDLLLKQIGSVL
jgi:hypothetical protein